MRAHFGQSVYKPLYLTIRRTAKLQAAYSPDAAALRQTLSSLMQDAYRDRGVKPIATGYKRFCSTTFQELGSYNLTTYSETSPRTVSTSYPGSRYLATL